MQVVSLYTRAEPPMRVALRLAIVSLSPLWGMADVTPAGVGCWRRPGGGIGLRPPGSPSLAHSGPPKSSA